MDASLVEYKIETWPTSIVGSVDRARGDEMVEGTLPDKEREKKKEKKEIGERTRRDDDTPTHSVRFTSEYRRSWSDGERYWEAISFYT